MHKPGPVAFPPQQNGTDRMLYRLSAGWARLEVAVAAALALSVSALILLNVVTRSLGRAIYWVDETAIYAMVWMTFLAASAAIHYRSAIAVTLVPELAPEPVARFVARAVDAVVLVFALAMAVLCWRWFMPWELARAGFDVRAFQGATFNFIYAEPTSTLGIRKVWVWLAMPAFALGATLHASANLLYPGAVPRREAVE